MQTVVVMLILSIGVFLLVSLLPGDPVYAMLGDSITPQEYDIEITAVEYDESRRTKNLRIRVTDEELLEKTGGIVQGFSGSPILQDGYLAGAVTHVLVDNPCEGYGIFAETMWEESRNLQ